MPSTDIESARREVAMFYVEVPVTYEALLNGDRGALAESLALQATSAMRRAVLAWTPEPDIEGD